MEFEPLPKSLRGWKSIFVYMGVVVSLNPLMLIIHYLIYSRDMYDKPSPFFSEILYKRLFWMGVIFTPIILAIWLL
jgi:hypothetical protein